MTNTTYNGWTNWETWNFNLWYGDLLQEMVSEYYEEAEETADHGKVHVIVEGFIDQLLEEQNTEAGFFSDAIGHAVQGINVHEIVEHLLSEY